MTETKTYKTWGYSKDDARVFEIEAGGELPEGYYDSPKKVPADEPKKKPAAKKVATKTTEPKEASEEE